MKKDVAPSNAGTCTVYGRATAMWSIFFVAFVAYVLAVYFVVYSIDFSSKQ